MKCTVCEATAEQQNRWSALDAGWRLTEFYGPTGNKYAVFCPNETTAKVLEVSKECVESVSGKRKKHG